MLIDLPQHTKTPLISSQDKNGHYHVSFIAHDVTDGDDENLCIMMVESRGKGPSNTEMNILTVEDYKAYLSSDKCSVSEDTAQKAKTILGMFCHCGSCPKKDECK